MRQVKQRAEGRERDKKKRETAYWRRGITFNQGKKGVKEMKEMKMKGGKGKGSYQLGRWRDTSCTGLKPTLGLLLSWDPALPEQMVSRHNSSWSWKAMSWELRAHWIWLTTDNVAMPSTGILQAHRALQKSHLKTACIRKIRLCKINAVNMNPEDTKENSKGREQHKDC